MNPYNEVLLKMSIIEKSAPLECEHEADARYQWPTRWELLKDFLISQASQPINPADAEGCEFCRNMVANKGYHFCHRCGRDLRR